MVRYKSLQVAFYVAQQQQAQTLVKTQKYLLMRDLVLDSLIMNIMEVRLQEDDYQAGFLLNGFPRTIH